MDRPQSLDPAPECPATPEALSHRQLTELLVNAPREADHSQLDGPETSEDDSTVLRLRHLLAQHEQLTQAILQDLSRQGDSLQRSYTPHQLMALGALAAHLRLGLQALEASRH